MIILNKYIKNNILPVIVSTALLLISCKKKATNNIDPEETISEISAPVFETTYGDCMDYQWLGTSPVTILSSGDLIVSSLIYDGVNDKLLISRVSSNGALIWQKTLNNGYKFTSGNCFETTTNELIVIGSVVQQNNWTNSKMYIAKLNLTTSDTLWTRTYGYSYIDQGIMGWEDLNHNYWVVDFNNQNHKATLLNISSTGDSITSVLNNEADIPTYRSAYKANNGDIIIIGESGTVISGKIPIYFCRYGIDGTKKNSSSIVLNNFDQIRVNNICETSDGNYMVVGECFNFASTSLRYGFLVKIDPGGNKIWEKILDMSNNTAVYSIVEKTQDIFYLGIGNSGNAKLYKYDLGNLTLLNSDYVTTLNDLQLLKKGNNLYRSLLDIKPSFYETVKLKKYTIN